jgi:hypothetical protein
LTKDILAKGTVARILAPAREAWSSIAESRLTGRPVDPVGKQRRSRCAPRPPLASYRCRSRIDSCCVCPGPHPGFHSLQQEAALPRRDAHGLRERPRSNHPPQRRTRHADHLHDVSRSDEPHRAPPFGSAASRSWFQMQASGHDDATRRSRKCCPINKWSGVKRLDVREKCRSVSGLRVFAGGGSRALLSSAR